MSPSARRRSTWAGCGQLLSGDGGLRSSSNAAPGPLPDIIAANLDVLFCGINPGLYSAQVGHHFARPGNRFWPTLHRAGFTQRQLSPFEDASLPDFGLGLTNIASRPSAAAAELP